MASVTADDVIKRLGDMATRRADFEKVWRQVADVAATDAPEFQFGGLGRPDMMGTGIHRANAARRSKKLYDGTASWATDRLASGLEGLIMPQSDIWHGLQPDDLFNIFNELSDEDQEWLENLSRLMFRIRYDARSGWQTAIQVALRRLVAFGNALMFVEDGEGGDSALIRYRHLPLSECYLAEDHYGYIDTVYRVYTLTARQAVQKFGEKVSQSIKNAANNKASGNKEQYFQFIHCISPRSDFGAPRDGIKNQKWASLHIEHASRNVVAESGFFEFPIIDFRWLPEPGRVYGESPIMRVLSDVQSINLMSKTEMVASQQAIRPPLLMKRNGIVNRPNTNPGAMIAGGIDDNGRDAIKPLNLGARIDFAQAVIQAKRENLRESLYINLFATMVQNPRMSATEALIKSQEKGELLGPAGSRIQQSLSKLVNRELGILLRFGLFDEDSRFAPPQNLQGKSIGTKFQSPLDRLRRAKDAEGAMRTMEVMAPVAQFDQGVFDHVDPDNMVRGVADVFGMPRSWLRTSEEVEQIRKEREEAQAAQQQLQMAAQAADAAQKAAPALQTLQEIGG